MMMPINAKHMTTIPIIKPVLLEPGFSVPVEGMLLLLLLLLLLAVLLLAVLVLALALVLVLP